VRIDPDEYRLLAGKEVKLGKRPSRTKPVYASKEDYEALLREHIDRLSALQQVLYASNTRALLIIFQGMDGAGKDGAIRHVMSGVNPQGCEVHSFKQPSADEVQHDFLWRTHVRTPARGRIGIFNRSHYEEVLIVRVHPEFLVNEGFDPKAAGHKKFWKDRYEAIVDFERHLDRNGTSVIKLFLHLSREEQRQRFLDRIERPEKTWKFNLADVQERKFWKRYMNAYEECLGATTTSNSPWFIVPADDKDNARLIVSQIILETLEEMDLHFPKPDASRLRELETIGDELLRKR